MCYDNNARPPMPPGADGSSRGEDIVVTAADGNQFAAYVAYPRNPAQAQVLIYPDVRGLHPFYKDLAMRFADIGIAAIAMDYFGRTAGLTPRDDGFEYRPHVAQLRLPNIFADAQAAIARLKQGGGGDAALFTVGFCLGGSLSLYTGTEDFGQAGVIGFYAGLSRNMDPQKGSVLDASRQIKCPVLGLFGGADQGIPVEQVQQLDRNLDEAGIDHEIVIYPDAPHSFFDRKQADFATQSADAWERIMRFIAAHSAEKQPA